METRADHHVLVVIEKLREVLKRELTMNEFQAVWAVCHLEATPPSEVVNAFDVCSDHQGG